MDHYLLFWSEILLTETQKLLKRITHSSHMKVNILKSKKERKEFMQSLKKFF